MSAFSRSSIIDKAKQNIEVAQEKQRAHYNRKHASMFTYNLGSKVLVKDFSRKKRKEGKMDFRWLGPYCILKNLGKGIYLLQEQGTNNERKVNGAHFKPYIDSGSEAIQSKEQITIGEEIDKSALCSRVIDGESEVTKSGEHIIDSEKDVPCNEDIRDNELEPFSCPSSPNKPHTSEYPACNEDNYSEL